MLAYAQRNCSIIIITTQNLYFRWPNGAAVTAFILFFSLLGCFVRSRLDPARGSARAIIIARVGGAV
jgi:hypothetical protein